MKRRIYMDAIIGLLSSLGIIVFLVMLIIRTIKKKPKKPMVIGLIICFLLFVIAVSMGETPEDTLESGQATTNQESNNDSVTNSEEIQSKDNDEETQSNEPSQSNNDNGLDSSGTITNSPNVNIPSGLSGELKVHFIDVGQADSIFIDYGDYDILIDAGNNNDGSLVVEYLRQLNTDDIEIMIATHPHEDHIGGIDDVLKAFDVEMIIDSGYAATTKTYEDYLNAAAIEKQKGAKLLKDDNLKYEIAEGIYFEIIEAGDDFKDTNDYSVISRLVAGEIEFLFTGDAEKVVESRLLNRNIQSDVLKVGHHGSSSSTSVEFLKKVNSSYGVISVGKDNSYGHPNADILSRLKSAGVEVFRTDIQGSIVAATDGKTVNFNKSPVKVEIANNNTTSNGQSGSTSSSKTTKATNTNTNTNTQTYIGGVIIQNINLSGELVTIKNTSSQNVDMTGWTLLSVEGNQSYVFPNGYILKSGASISIATGDATGDIQWTGKNIWNNKGDPGVLFNSKGEEISGFGR